MLFLRSFVFNVLFYLHTILTTFFAILGHVFGRRFAVWVAYGWGIGTHFLLRWIVGLNYEIRGQEKYVTGGAIFACKHQSLLETTMIQVLAFDSNLILKRELLWIPFFGQALSAMNVIAVDRTRGKNAIEQLVSGALESFKKGQNFMIFPEGTRTSPEKPTRLKYGVASLYLQANRPVVPIVLNTGTFWARRSFLRYPGKVIYQYLDPIQPGLTEKEFMSHLQKVMEDGTRALDQETAACFQPKPRSFKGLWLGSVVILGALLGGGYMGVQRAQHALEVAINDFKADAQEKGLDLTYDNLTTGFRGLTYEMRLQHPALKIKYYPDFALKSQGTWILKKNLVSLASSQVDFDSEGKMTLGSLDASTPLVTLSRAQGSFTSQKMDMTLLDVQGFRGSVPKVVLERELDSEKGPKTRYSLHGHSLKIPGIAVPVDTMHVDVGFKEGLPQGIDASSLKSWSDAGGVMDIGSLMIEILPLKVTIAGSLSFDDVMKPLGAFTLTAMGLEKGIHRLEEAHILPSWLGRLLKFSLAFQGKKQALQETQEPVHQLSLTLQNGQVYLEGLPVMTLPDIDW